MRGFYRPVIHNCIPCRGTGKMMDETRTRVTHDCTSCNGTGMAGSPRALFFLLLVWLFILGFLIWLFFK